MVRKCNCSRCRATKEPESPIIVPDKLKDFHLKKRFQQGVHARSVELWVNEATGQKAVRKQYHQRHANIFRNEVKQMERLRECPFIPDLLFVDEKNLTLWSSYCGAPVTNLAKYSSVIRRQKEELKQTWGLHHNDIKVGNVCRLDGTLYFIDLGWTYHKKILPGYGPGRGFR